MQVKHNRHFYQYKNSGAHYFYYYPVNTIVKILKIHKTIPCLFHIVNFKYFEIHFSLISAEVSQMKAHNLALERENK